MHPSAHLWLSGGGAVAELHNLVVDGGRHADSPARIVGIEVLTLTQLYARRGVTVAVQQVVDVILTPVPREDI